MKIQYSYLKNINVKNGKCVLFILFFFIFIIKAGEVKAEITEENTDYFLIGNKSQQVLVNGIIRDANGRPIPGAEISIEGTALKTTSDTSGVYSINIPDGNSTLIFSSLGYKEIRIVVGSKTIIDISLELSEESDEAINTGYIYQRRDLMSSSISTVDMNALSKAPVANMSNAMIGLVAGVEIQNNQGRPGELPDIRIRGTGSMINTEPLYVINGIPMNDVTVTINDIESINILKDAGSCAIYGARGANGVIIITTKKGKGKWPTVSYSGYYGWEKPRKQLDLLNIHQWAEVVTESNNAAGYTPPPLAQDIIDNEVTGNYNIYDGTVTDWQDEIFQTGTISENTLKISGGSYLGNYNVSASRFEQKGIMIDTPYRRYSFHANTNWKFGIFKFGLNSSYFESFNHGEDDYDGRTIIEEAIKITPNIKVRNPALVGGYSGYDASVVGHYAGNPVGIANRRINIINSEKFTESLDAGLEIIEGLDFKITVGIMTLRNKNNTLTLKTDMPPMSYNNTTLEENFVKNFSWILGNTLSYQKVAGNHNLTVLASYIMEKSDYHSEGASAVEISSGVFGTMETLSVFGNTYERALISYLGSLNYAFKERYIMTINYRHDRGPDNNYFYPGLKKGDYPSASLAWRMSEEEFIKGISEISNLKLRASYGLTGNMISSDSWEKVRQFDAGLDIGLFNGKLEATVDYFNKRTQNLLLNVTDFLIREYGKVGNRGLEFTTTVNNNIGDLNFSVSANLYTSRNEVTDFEYPVFSGITENGHVTRTDNGHPIGAFYGRKSLGVFPDQASVEAYTKNGLMIQPLAQEGDIKWADLDKDGRIDSDDCTYLGSPIPDLTYGLLADFSYKGFDLSLFFQGVSGNEICAELVAWTEGMNYNYNLSNRALERWTPDNRYTDVPRAVLHDPNYNIKYVSDRYIKNGAYFRLRNATFGYTFPKKITKSVLISNLRVYLTGRNIITFTKYPFYDPEIGTGTVGSGYTRNISRGIDNGYYPQARTFIMGIQVDF